MMGAEFPRRVAVLLLRFAIWIAPHDTLDWGHGMLSELNHVEGNWSALLWSLGGAGVLAKHAMLALILPGSDRRAVSSASELFDKEAPMRKATLATIAACVATSLLFFLTPVFRQAFRVSLAQWHDVFHVQLVLGYPDSDPELNSLAREAEKNHDAEAIAFVATNHPNKVEGSRLADVAVHLDPNLTWIYATSGAWYIPSADTDRISALQQWDPQNAVAYLIAAQKIGLTVTHTREFPTGRIDQSENWKEAMKAAFQSPKFDDYLDRQKQLNRRVLTRYHVDDPFQLISDTNWYGFPTYGVWYSSIYTKSLLEEGRVLESRGDLKAAFNEYWTVARFTQMMGFDRGIFMGNRLKETYESLARVSEMQGNKAEAAFYSSLGDRLDKNAERELALRRRSFRGTGLSHWNAFLFRLSGALMLACAALLAICVLGLLIRNRSFRFPSYRPGKGTLVVSFSAAVGLVLASVLMFLTYRPYPDLIQRFLRDGDEASLTDVSSFLRDAQVPLGSQAYSGTQTSVMHFWVAVRALCVLALLLAVILHLRTRPRAIAPA